MHSLRPAFECGSAADRVPKRWRRALCALRPGGHPSGGFACAYHSARGHDVALRGGAARSGTGLSGRRLHAYAPQPGIREHLYQGRGTESDRIVQGAWTLRRDHDGEALRPEEASHSFRWKCRGRAGRVRGRCRIGSAHLHAQRCAHGKPDRMRILRGTHHAGGWSDQRLRAHGCRAQGEGRMVRRLHAERALSRGRQEDHGLRSGRAVGLAFAAGNYLSHRRRSRHDWNVEGF